MRAKRFRALALAAALVGWSLLVPRLPARWNPVPHAVVAATLAALTRPPLGLRTPASSSGVRLGSAAAALVLLGVAGVAALPRTRRELTTRALPAGRLRWLLLAIPFGTVWSEEAAYRGALGTTAADAFGPTGGRLLQAAVFGLSHIADARSTGVPVVPTVVATGVAGWLFAWLYERSGSLIAPMLAHLAINEGAAVAALAAQQFHASSRHPAVTG